MLKTASGVMKNGPGFTAEAALHQTRDRYGLELRPASGSDSQSVVPAAKPICTGSRAILTAIVSAQRAPSADGSGSGREFTWS